MFNGPELYSIWAPRWLAYGLHIRLRMNTWLYLSGIPDYALQHMFRMNDKWRKEQQKREYENIIFYSWVTTKGQRIEIFVMPCDLWISEQWFFIFIYHSVGSELLYDKSYVSEYIWYSYVDTYTICVTYIPPKIVWCKQSVDTLRRNYHFISLIFHQSFSLHCSLSEMLKSNKSLINSDIITICTVLSVCSKVKRIKRRIEMGNFEQQTNMY